MIYTFYMFYTAENKRGSKTAPTSFRAVISQPARSSQLR